jgi:pyruvate dehydrogenase E2 component (dihydrolipoamide acetyltransferase)
MAEFTMPSLGADMEEGTLVEWFVSEGDRVHRGDVVAAVDTDKATIEVEVFEDGVVERLLVEPGTVLPVGAPLAVIAGGRSTPEPAPVPTDAPDAPDAPDARPGPGGRGHHHAALVLSPVVRHLAERLGVDTGALRGTGAGGRVTRVDVERAARPRPSGPRSSPRARRRAAELGLDLATMPGTGPGGAVRERDVLTRAEHPAPRPDRAATMRRAIARSMERANREIPHYYVSTTVDLQAASDWLADHNADRPPDERLLPAALVLRAATRAAVLVPGVNGHWVDDHFEPASAVHLGVMVSLRDGGLVAPVIRDAADRSTTELMDVLRDLVVRARQGTLRSSEADGATISVTNLGDRGAESVHGVIHPPEVAILGVGRIAPRAFVVDGEVVAHQGVVLTLGADHRATDGQVGSRYLDRVAALLADPEVL